MTFHFLSILNYSNNNNNVKFNEIAAFFKSPLPHGDFPRSRNGDFSQFYIFFHKVWNSHISQVLKWRYFTALKMCIFYVSIDQPINAFATFLHVEVDQLPDKLLPQKPIMHEIHKKCLISNQLTLCVTEKKENLGKCLSRRIYPFLIKKFQKVLIFNV